MYAVNLAFLIRCQTKASVIALINCRVNLYDQMSPAWHLLYDTFGTEARDSTMSNMAAVLSTIEACVSSKHLVKLDVMNKTEVALPFCEHYVLEGQSVERISFINKANV